MISISHNFVFIHIPKTGGNSIQSVLLPYHNGIMISDRKRQDGEQRFGIIDQEFGLSKHSTLAEHERNIPSSIFLKTFKFATIRNPWERALSFYFHRPSKNNQDFKKAFLDRLGRLEPVSHYICLDKKPAIDVSTPNKSANHLNRDITKLIRFENIQQDFIDVCRQINIPESKLPKLNTSSHGHYREYFDNEIREIIAEKYWAEIALGGYEYE